MEYSMIKPWLNEGLLTSGGNKWRHRRLINDFFVNIIFNQL